MVPFHSEERGSKVCGKLVGYIGHPFVDQLNRWPFRIGHNVSCQHNKIRCEAVYLIDDRIQYPLREDLHPSIVEGLLELIRVGRVVRVRELNKDERGVVYHHLQWEVEGFPFRKVPVPSVERPGPAGGADEDESGFGIRFQREHAFIIRRHHCDPIAHDHPRQWKIGAVVLQIVVVVDVDRSGYAIEAGACQDQGTECYSDRQRKP